MRKIGLLVLIMGVVLVGARCGSSGGSDTDSSDQATVQVSMYGDGASAMLSKVASLDICNEVHGDMSNQKCIEPSNYTVGLQKIELLVCDGECSVTEGQVTNVSSAVTLYECANDPDNCDSSSGRVIDLSEVQEFESDIINRVDGGTYGGLRFELPYLQQTIPAADIEIPGVPSRDIIFRICAQAGGCPDAADSQPGDIMINYGMGFLYMDANDPLINEASRADISGEVMQHESFASHTEFTPGMANDGGDQVVVGGAVYDLEAVFVIGGAFSFEDQNDNDIFDPMNDGGEGSPERPQSLSMNMTLVE